MLPLTNVGDISLVSSMMNPELNEEFDIGWVCEKQ
jgi:hypothetical protein